LINSGFGYPNKAVLINLAPADVRKEGAEVRGQTTAKGALQVAAAGDHNVL
jgi:predicted ATPase with chaperone activity